MVTKHEWNELNRDPVEKIIERWGVGDEAYTKFTDSYILQG